MKSYKTGNVQTALQGVSKSARKKAFRKKLPVAISENGKTVLVFPDGSRTPYSAEAIADLKNAS